MGNDDHSISDDERDLFRQETSNARPLARPPRRLLSRPLPSARPRSREADDAEVIASLLTDAPHIDDIDTGDELFYRQPGIQLAVMRRLRRGHYNVQAELDLHGMFVEPARRATAEFLLQARDRDFRCVRIVHGKGLRSGNRGPILKIKLAHWLRQRREVLAYCSARAVDGGTGAVYVLLRTG